jgi:Sensors of blue-light using FAD
MMNTVTDEPLATRAPAGPPLFAIIYISTAARGLSPDELEYLRHRAQARNLQEGVTGVLLYADGAFMQYLEGPAAGLARIYGRIKADALHYGMIDLLREPIQAREFAGWSMALRVVSASGLATVSELGPLLNEVPGALDPPRSMARQLLLDFWSKGRCSVAPTLLDFSAQRARRLAKAPPV